MKKTLSIILAVVMLFSMTVAVSADDFVPFYSEDAGRWIQDPRDDSLRTYSNRDRDSASTEDWLVTDAETAIASWTAESVVFLQPEETYFQRGDDIKINRSQKYTASYANDKVERWTAVTVQDLIDAKYKTTRVLVLNETTTELKKGSIIRIKDNGDAMVSSSGKKRETLSSQEKSDRENNLEIDLR